MKTLIPVLGEQLSPGLSGLADADRADTVVPIMEMTEEASFVRHHKAKLA